MRQKPERTRAIHYLALARQLCAQNQSRFAMKVLQRALCCDPTYSILYQEKACLLAILGRREGTLRVIDQAIECDPDDIVNWKAAFQPGMLRGGVRHHHGDGSLGGTAFGYDAETIEDLDVFLKCYPAHAHALVYQGKALGHLGCFQEALVAQEQALASRSLPSIHAMASTQKGDVLHLLGLQNEAEEAYEYARYVAALPLDPQVERAMRFAHRITMVRWWKASNQYVL